MRTKNDFLTALNSEIELQKNYLEGEKIDTLYFGGGTPSILSKFELGQIIDQLNANFELSQNAEFTLEANPDDLSTEKLKEIKSAGINRLSIGIQTFDNELLQFYNRAHNSEMALASVKEARNLGFENISIDIIFGAPNQKIESLKKDLETALSLETPHISIYGLTIEEGTAFGKWHEKGKLRPLKEESGAQHFELIMTTLKAAGYEQYEISNFSKKGFESQHNSSYWQNITYLGLGPSAHSYNGYSRQYNVANNVKYIQRLNEGEIPCETEKLSEKDKINEYILIRMRLASGLNFEEFKSKFSIDFVHSRNETIEEMVETKMLELSTNNLRFTDKGKLLADFIIEKLIF